MSEPNAEYQHPANPRNRAGPVPPGSLDFRSAVVDTAHAKGLRSDAIDDGATDSSAMRRLYLDVTFRHRATSLSLLLLPLSGPGRGASTPGIRSIRLVNFSRAQSQQVKTALKLPKQVLNFMVSGVAARHMATDPEELPKANGQKVKIETNHSMTAQQIGWFKAGSALNALG